MAEAPHAHHHHGQCCHDHGDTKEDQKDKPETAPDPLSLIKEKQGAVQSCIERINAGLKGLEPTTQDNIKCIEQDFGDLLRKLTLRRDTLIKQMSEIRSDKESVLNKQLEDLKAYQSQLTAESNKPSSEMSTALLDKEISMATSADIILSVNNDKLSDIIAHMGDVNNTFPPNPPQLSVDEVKAMTCKLTFALGEPRYDGFQAPSVHLVEAAFAPKPVDGSEEADDECKIDFEALKWKTLTDKEKGSFVRVKRLKPSTVYFMRAKCKNAYGWSDLCEPLRLVTGELKINTKIMNSDEVGALIELVKERHKASSLQWKLLFRGSDDGFLASTFHEKCDGIGNTICVIESNHGNVFGGFTTLPWKSDVGRYHVDEDAFVFIVRKKKKALKKALVYLQYSSSQHSVVHNKYMGPVFGYGHDIYIRNKANKVEDNSCRNHTYQCSYAGELAGQEKFRVINYEVFQIDWC